MSFRSAIALTLTALLFGLPAQSQPSPPARVEESPWQVQVGQRILALRERVPTVDRVVLVPDEATFLVAIQEWSLAGRWPILLDDERYAPLFIERFQPTEVVRLPAIGTPLPTGEDLRTAMHQAIAPAWNAADAQSLPTAWKRLNWVPPGVVLTWEKDTAWPAAVALAADRGQPLAFLSGNYGEVNGEIHELAQWTQLDRAVLEAVDATGYPYQGLGDAIDTVTVVRDLPVQYDKRATTDRLARHATGQRWAVTGWLFGSAERSLYSAMCSIFLSAKSVLVYNSYAANEEPWITYSTDDAAALFEAAQLDVRHIQPPEASRQTWLSLSETTPFSFDVILMSSRGPRRSFLVGEGRARVDDIPQLLTPTAMHLIHSGSAAAPADPNTVAGRWLDRGVYAYIGSVREPRLSAFVPPKHFTARLLSGVPFLVAARRYDLKPWRLTTIGDPLMVLFRERERLPPSSLPLQSSRGFSLDATSRRLAE